MTTYLDDVLDPDELGLMLEQGYIQVRFHPDYPYAIYCYTKKAMFDRVWNQTTRSCRGLIINEETSEVLARPFEKFFNYGEPNAAQFSDGDWVSVYDKADGSLGIAYETPDGPAIATKGSFTSEQAAFATELLRGQYGRYMADDYCTDLFEIIYPENRIVLDYGETSELRYLGSVAIQDGTFYWNGLLMNYFDIPKNKLLIQSTWPDVLDQIDLERPNAEGVVIYNDDTGDRLKVKQEDYIELHKVMTGLNERQLWEWLNAGYHESEIYKKIPEEMHDWARAIVTKLIDGYSEIRDGAWAAKDYWFNKGVSRKEIAQGISGYPPATKAAIFCLLDGSLDRAEEIAWKAVRP